MASGKIDKLRDIASRFRTGQLTLHDASIEAGMTEDQFTKAVQSFAWVEDKAGQAAHLASGATRVGQRLWNRWTGKR